MPLWRKGCYCTPSDLRYSRFSLFSFNLKKPLSVNVVLVDIILWNRTFSNSENNLYASLTNIIDEDQIWNYDWNLTNVFFGVELQTSPVSEVDERTLRNISCRRIDFDYNKSVIIFLWNSCFLSGRYVNNRPVARVKPLGPPNCNQDRNQNNQDCYQNNQGQQLCYQKETSKPPASEPARSFPPAPVTVEDNFCPSASPDPKMLPKPTMFFADKNVQGQPPPPPHQGFVQVQLE